MAPGNIFLCSLDPEQKEQLVEVIEKLLKDQTTVNKEKKAATLFPYLNFNLPLSSWWQVVLLWHLRLCVQNEST